MFIIIAVLDLFLLFFTERSQNISKVKKVDGHFPKELIGAWRVTFWAQRNFTHKIGQKEFFKRYQFIFFTTTKAAHQVSKPFSKPIQKKKFSSEFPPLKKKKTAQSTHFFKSKKRNNKKFRQFYILHFLYFFLTRKLFCTFLYLLSSNQLSVVFDKFCDMKWKTTEPAFYCILFFPNKSFVAGGTRVPRFLFDLNGILRIKTHFFGF